MPPESFSQALGLADEDVVFDLKSASSWDIATRYHEFKTKPSLKKNEKLADHIRKISARAVLDRAQAILGSIVRPMDRKLGTLDSIPPDASEVEIEIDETIENSPFVALGKAVARNEDLWMEYQVRRGQAVILSVDTSLSMTGEKLALTAVALAVVLLQFPDDPIGIVAFENESRILKSPDERISLEQLIERFLDVPAQGYTHLESGVRTALELVKNSKSLGIHRPPSAVLLTDGKYTAGKDPAYLASRFPHLVVMKMGNERSSRELCREMAKKGSGALREIDHLEALPQAMYSVVKDLLRGRSLR